MGKIADIIYDTLGYMYCDNCRNAIDGNCDECHRKYNNWGVSMETAELIEQLCVEQGVDLGEDKNVE